MRTEYIAMDGTRFDDRETCLRYENEQGCIVGWRSYEDDMTNAYNFLHGITLEADRAIYENPLRDIIKNNEIIYIGNVGTLKRAKPYGEELTVGFNLWNGEYYVPAAKVFTEYKQALANLESVLNTLSEDMGLTEVISFGDNGEVEDSEDDF